MAGNSEESEKRRECACPRRRVRVTPTGDVVGDDMVAVPKQSVKVKVLPDGSITADPYQPAKDKEASIPEAAAHPRGRVTRRGTVEGE